MFKRIISVVSSFIETNYVSRLDTCQNYKQLKHELYELKNHNHL